jgi:hypothetical protein
VTLHRLNQSGCGFNQSGCGFRLTTAYAHLDEFAIIASPRSIADVLVNQSPHIFGMKLRPSNRSASNRDAPIVTAARTGFENYFRATTQSKIHVLSPRQLQKRSSLRRSSRRRPMKLSGIAFCIGLSCAMSCQVTPVPAEDGHRDQFCQSAQDLNDPAPTWEPLEAKTACRLTGSAPQPDSQRTEDHSRGCRLFCGVARQRLGARLAAGQLC